MKRLLLLISAVIVVALSTAAEAAFPYRAALRVRDVKVVSPEEMMEEIRSADMIFVGETHDDELHHQAQLAIIAWLHEREESLAVGLEMFRSEDQKYLDRWTAGTLDLRPFIRRYYDNWRIAWPLYRDIFLYARDHRIPLIGLNVPEAITEKVSQQGFGALSPKELKQLPPGISCNIDRHYMDFISRAYRAHGREGKSFVNFCEAQMVWDKAMAWRLMEYKKKNRGKKIVVLAGMGHAWKPGIPAYIAQGSRYSYRVVLPALPEALDDDSGIGDLDADYILLR